jgi:hypothetical protein
VVSSTQPAAHEGTPCQLLTCRFERAGLKTISTGVADIRRADEAEAEPPETAPDGWLDTIEKRDLPERMARLPESTRDPFTTLEARLRATLDLFRFSDRGVSLLDWAAMQTRLKDPMTRFNRHELEEFFRRFAHSRDEHLRSLLLEAKRREPDAIARAAAGASPEARSAMQRLYDGR